MKSNREISNMSPEPKDEFNNMSPEPKLSAGVFRSFPPVWRGYFAVSVNFRQDPSAWLSRRTRWDKRFQLDQPAHVIDEVLQSETVTERQVPAIVWAIVLDRGRFLIDSDVGDFLLDVAMLFRCKFPIVLFVFILAGCMSPPTTEMGQAFNVSNADKIVIGKSTKNDVLSLLGSPKNQLSGLATPTMGMSSQGQIARLETWSYEYTKNEGAGVHLPFMVKTGAGTYQSVRVSFSGNVVQDCIVMVSNAPAQSGSVFSMPNLDNWQTQQRRCGQTP